ncbi:MAG: hypothetical protein M9894_14250 [Planctomycetes bacterium]|nr:hypothetical protein [Planctomycetota bacterium]
MRRGFMVDRLEANGLFDEFRAQHWPFGNTRGGTTKIRRYRRLREEYERYMQGQEGPADERQALSSVVGEPRAGDNDGVAFGLEAGYGVANVARGVPQHGWPHARAHPHPGARP